MHRHITRQLVTDMNTRETLRVESERFHGSGATSQESRGFGFSPAFLDSASGRVHPSRFADGSLAPIHVLDGLPNELIANRNAHGGVIAVWDFVISGFIRGHQFYTREEVARLWLEGTSNAAISDKQSSRMPSSSDHVGAR
jgi:hypothetical protein